MFALIFFTATVLVRLATKARLAELRKEVQHSSEATKIIGFFHPFCDAMGGGEKVLFQALKAI